MKIYDVHAHVYPQKIAPKAVVAIGDFYEIPMEQDGTVESLLIENKKAGICHSVIHSVAVHWEQAEKINQFIAKTVQDYPEKYTGFGAVHPEDPKVINTLEEIKTLGLKGLKLHPDFQHFAIDDKVAYPIYNWAQENSFPIVMHTGDRRFTTSNPERMEKVLKNFPKLQVVCAHLGGWSQWEEAYKILAKYENAWIDTSSSLYALSPCVGKKIIEKYDIKKVLFGTDYPMWNPKQEVERFLALGLTDGQNEDILHNNGKRFLGLNA